MPCILVMVWWNTMRPIANVAPKTMLPLIPMVVRPKMTLSIAMEVQLKTMLHIAVVARWTTMPRNTMAAQ